MAVWALRQHFQQQKQHACWHQRSCCGGLLYLVSRAAVKSRLLGVISTLGMPGTRIALEDECCSQYFLLCDYAYAVLCCAKRL
jgi:hypothetical protein